VARNARDAELGRRLRAGHAAIAEALRGQRAAAAGALDALPLVDAAHASLLRSLAVRALPRPAPPNRSRRGPAAAPCSPEAGLSAVPNA
jgi:hypothetical protein